MRSAIFSPSSSKSTVSNGLMLSQHRMFNGSAEPPPQGSSCGTTTTTPPHPHLVLPLKEEFSHSPLIHPQMKHSFKWRNQQLQNSTWHGHKQLRLLLLPRDLLLLNFSWLGLPVMNGRRLQLLDHLERAWISEALFIRVTLHRPVSSDSSCRIVEELSGGNCSMRLRWERLKELVLWPCTHSFRDQFDQRLQES